MSLFSNSNKTWMSLCSCHRKVSLIIRLLFTVNGGKWYMRVTMFSKILTRMLPARESERERKGRKGGSRRENGGDAVTVQTQMNDAFSRYEPTAKRYTSDEKAACCGDEEISFPQYQRRKLRPLRGRYLINHYVPDVDPFSSNPLLFFFIFPHYDSFSVTCSSNNTLRAWWGPTQFHSITDYRYVRKQSRIWDFY